MTFYTQVERSICTYLYYNLFIDNMRFCHYDMIIIFSNIQNQPKQISSLCFDEVSKLSFE